MFDFIKAITTELFSIPSSHNDDGTVNASFEAQNYRWRLKTVTISLSTAIVLGVHLANFYGVIGYPVATGKDLDMLQRDVTQIQVAALESRLDKYYTALCMNPGDQTLLEVIRDLQDKYKMLTNYRYTPPSCDVLFKVKGAN